MRSSTLLKAILRCTVRPSLPGGGGGVYFFTEAKTKRLYEPIPAFARYLHYSAVRSRTGREDSRSSEG